MKKSLNVKTSLKKSDPPLNEFLNAIHCTKRYVNDDVCLQISFSIFFFITSFSFNIFTYVASNTYNEMISGNERSGKKEILK